MNNGKIGDRAILVRFDGDWLLDGLESFIGEEVTLVGPASLGWRLDLPGYSRDLDCSERHLKPLYDGNEKTSWEDCVWKPKELVIAGITSGCYWDL